MRRTVRRRRGFTLIELLVAFTVLVGVLLAILLLFDLNSRLARSQIQVADMQQALRVGQYTLLREVRMAGRGGLPRGLMPDLLAVAVRNNAPEEGDLHYIASGDADSPAILAGTDVLTVRGVFGSPVYQIEPTAGSLTLDDPLAPTRGTIRVQDPSPSTGVPQDLEPLLQALDAGRPDALVLVSPVDDAIYAVVEIDPSTCPDRACLVAGTLTMDFKVTGGAHTAGYLALSPGGVFPAGLTSVAFLGLLEEQRFYIRDEHAVPGDETSDLSPRLSRARFYPGTEQAWGDSVTNLQADLADNILDLQVALGFDVDADGVIADDGTAGDEWLFNHADDDPEDLARWNGDGVTVPRLYYVRASTLARTDRRELDYLAPGIASLEDRSYGETDLPADDAERRDRMFRRRLLVTTADLRNLS